VTEYILCAEYLASNQDSEKPHRLVQSQVSSAFGPGELGILQLSWPPHTPQTFDHVSLLRNIPQDGHLARRKRETSASLCQAPDPQLGSTARRGLPGPNRASVCVLGITDVVMLQRGPDAGLSQCSECTQSVFIILSP
jgi:hypothetical protein